MRGGISAVVAILLVACSSLTAIQAEGLYAGQRREDLFPNSDVVALVTVEQVSQRLNAADNKPWGDRTVAFHVAAVRSSRVFKGSAPVEITQTGGTVGDFTYNLEHAKYLEAGEQYLVFLDRWSIAEKEGVRDSLG